MAVIDSLKVAPPESRTVTEIDEEIALLNSDLTRSTDDAHKFEELVRRLEALQFSKQRIGASPLSSPVVASIKGAQITRQARPAKPAPREGYLPANWGDSYRGFPNDLIRTSLFNVRRAEPRQQLTNAVIATFSNAMMLYTGEELRIKDEDVLMQILHFQRNFRLGDAWEANGRDFLTSMHWTDGKRGYYDLYDCLLRLNKGHLTLMRRTDGVDSFVIEAGALLSDLKIEHGGRSGPTRITITVNPKTLVLWESMGYTLVNWQQRLDLSGSLSRYLHRFYSSHHQPYPLKVMTLHQLTGSTASTRGKFAQLLKDALQALVDINFLAAFWIDKSDLVHVRRTHAALTN